MIILTKSQIEFFKSLKFTFVKNKTNNNNLNTSFTSSNTNSNQIRSQRQTKSENNTPYKPIEINETTKKLVNIESLNKMSEKEQKIAALKEEILKLNLEQMTNPQGQSNEQLKNKLIDIT